MNYYKLPRLEKVGAYFGLCLIFCLPLYSKIYAAMPCTSPTVNTGTTTITPSAAWQTVVMVSGAVRYVEFSATTGNSYVFTCNSTVGGAASGVDEQFSILTSANASAGGVYSTSYVDTYGSGTKERIIWSPSSNGTYRLVLSKYASASDCQALTANATVAYITFGATQNFAFWTGFSSTTFGTAANWFRRATTGYPAESAPTSSYDAYLPSGSSNQPNCADVSASVNSLTINSGATLSMSYAVNSLSVYGNLTNNGTINHSGSIYIYLYGSGKTFGGTGNFFAGAASPFNIAAGASYTLQNSVSIRHMYVEPTGSFDMNGYDITTEFFFQVGTLYLRTGNLNIWGNSDASMWYNPGDNLNPYFSTDGNFVPGTGTVYYCEGDTYTGGNQLVRTTTYYNLKIRTHNGYTTTIGTSGTITVSNDLTFLNSGTAGGVATSAYDVTVGNNLYIGNTGNALTLNLGNRIYRASGTGTLTMGNVTAHAINITYASSSNYAIAGFGTPTFYGTVTYNSSSAQKVIPATYYHMTTNGTGTKTMYGNIDVDGNLTLSNGSLVQGTYTINVAGNWTSTGNYYTEGTGMVTFDGTGASTITCSSATIGGSTGNSLFTESFENAGAIPSGWGTTTVTNPSGTAPALTYVTSSTYPTGFSPTAGSYFVRFNSYSSESGDQIRLRRTSSFSTSGYSNIVVNFDWSKDNEYSGSNDYVTVQYSTNGTSWTSAGSAVYRYSASGDAWSSQSVTLPAGAENQATLYIAFLYTSAYGNDCHLDNVSVTGDVSGTAYSGEAYNSVTVNKTGGGTVALASKIFIQTGMTFTSGIVTSTASFYPEFDEDAVVANTPSASSHVSGYVVKRTNTTTKFTFPVGSGTAYRACAVTPSSTSSTTWTAKYFPSGHSDTDVDGSGLDHILTNEYWTIDRSGAADATVELTWDASSGVTDYTLLNIAHYDGTTDWDRIASTPVGTNSAGVLTSDAVVSTYSPFTIGVINNVVLPTEMLSFEAHSKVKKVEITWVTVTENNSDYFLVERSYNGWNFETIARIDAKGFSTQKVNYLLDDIHYQKGINYYRLKQYDQNGNYVYSSIISVDMKQGDNPVVMTVNAHGQEVDKYFVGVVFDVYSDGTTVKRVQ